VQFLDNSCSDNPHGAGVSFEGTDGGAAYRNKLTRTAGAAIRIASNKSFNTGPVSGIDLKDNVLTGVRTVSNGQAAILVYSNLANVSNVSFANNTITNPAASTGAQVLNYDPTNLQISGVTFNGTINTSTNGIEKKCFDVSGSGVTSLSLVNNTLNSLLCS
jgi:hypothetical protein